MANSTSTSTSSYLNAQNSYTKEEVAKGNKYFAQDSVNKLGQEVGTIGGLDGSTDTLTKKQDASTDGGCGTSFTTATDARNISVKTEVNGNLVKVATVNEQGDVQYKVIKADGSSFTMSEDGSIIFTTAKRGGDPATGKFDVCAAGGSRIKIGENFLIEIGNKSDLNSSKEGDSKKTAKAMSIVVYGNVDIESIGGDISAKGKNINLNAENELKLYAGAKIDMTTGKGKAGDKGTETTEAKVEYGGLVEIKTGDYKLEATTVRKDCSMDYKVVSSEGMVATTNTTSAYGMTIPGSFELNVSGDYLESITGKKRTAIGNVSPLIGSMLPGQDEGYLINVAGVSKGNAVGISAASGGFGFDTTLGDISMYTVSGGVAMSSKTAGEFSIINADKKGTDGKSLGLIPGVYVKGIAKPVYISTTGDKIGIGIGDVSKGVIANGITIGIAKLELKNTAGIYLN